MNGEEKLKAIRESIDRIDANLLELLNQRMELARDAARIKASRGIPLFDPGREADIQERLSRANQGPLAETSLKAIYREILAASRQIQEEMGVGRK